MWAGHSKNKQTKPTTTKTQKSEVCNEQNNTGGKEGRVETTLEKESDYKHVAGFSVVYTTFFF